jgi:hypothetical protein
MPWIGAVMVVLKVAVWVALDADYGFSNLQERGTD